MPQNEELIKYWRDRFLIHDDRVITAFSKVQREHFVPSSIKHRAYDDVPLPIGCNQTISQPTTVVMMVQALDIEPGNVILEVGAGSGYQAALLAELTSQRGHVYTIEYEKELYETAKKHLRGRKNITIIHGDGSTGLSQHAPFDRIILSAACPSIPDQTIAQLKEGGIIVAPVGSRYEQQVIRGVKRHHHLETRSLGKFTFVPLRGKYGFTKEDLSR